MKRDSEILEQSNSKTSQSNLYNEKANQEVPDKSFDVLDLSCDIFKQLASIKAQHDAQTTPSKHKYSLSIEPSQ